MGFELFLKCAIKENGKPYSERKRRNCCVSTFKLLTTLYGIKRHALRSAGVKRNRSVKVRFLCVRYR